MKISPLFEKLMEFNRREPALNKALKKGIDKQTIDVFSTPTAWGNIGQKILDGTLNFPPAKKVKIPKDTPGEYREVYVGSPIERILCSMINDCLFELFPEMVHKNCKSYQKKLNCGSVVQKMTEKLVKVDGNIVGGKYDFHAYFDTVLKEVVFGMFDKIEAAQGFEKGTEPVTELLRRIFSNDWLIDVNGNPLKQWSGIRQGNAVGSWLADSVLYELDDFMSKKYKFYCRYSDDLVVIYNDVNKITGDINNIVTKYGVSLNPKKVETLTKDKFFKFLGFSVRGSEISLSARRLKEFQNEIEKRTVRNLHYDKRNKKWVLVSFAKALHSVMSYLYGDITKSVNFSWGTACLPFINCLEDLKIMNEFVMDCLRAVITGKTSVGGLGYVPTQKCGVVVRGIGHNVTSNKTKTPKEIIGYCNLTEMRNALLYSRSVYETLLRDAYIRSFSIKVKVEEENKLPDNLLFEEAAQGHHYIMDFQKRFIKVNKKVYTHTKNAEFSKDKLLELFNNFYYSFPTENKYVSYFKHADYSELDESNMWNKDEWNVAQAKLEDYIFKLRCSGFKFSDLESENHFFWQCPENKNLILLRSWFE